MVQYFFYERKIGCWEVLVVTAQSYTELGIPVMSTFIALCRKL